MNVGAILQRSQGKAHQRRTTIDGKQVGLALHLSDELPDDGRPRFEFTVYWVPNLDSACCHLSIKRVRKPMQRRREPLVRDPRYENLAAVVFDVCDRE